MSDLHEKFVESQLEGFNDLRLKHNAKRELNPEDFRLTDEMRLKLAEEPPKPDRMLQFFEYDHLPEVLKDASRPFCQLARIVVDTYPMNPERTVCLRKLLEAKDAAVRTMLYQG